MTAPMPSQSLTNVALASVRFLTQFRENSGAAKRRPCVRAIGRPRLNFTPLSRPICYSGTLDGRGPLFGHAFAIRTPAHWDCAAWIGLTISGTKRPCIGNLPSRPTTLSLKPNCLSWPPCAKRSPVTSKIISQAGKTARPRFNFTSLNGLLCCSRRCPLCSAFQTQVRRRAESEKCHQRNSVSLFDHPVSASDNRLWDAQAKGRGCLEI
jgi:hypothetical protein